VKRVSFGSAGVSFDVDLIGADKIETARLKQIGPFVSLTDIAQVVNSKYGNQPESFFHHGMHDDHALTAAGYSRYGMFVVESSKHEDVSWDIHEAYFLSKMLRHMLDNAKYRPENDPLKGSGDNQK
jgi:hypothetical protein